MEREAGINVVEKRRLRDAIKAQVRHYLERGGRITVVQTSQGEPLRSAHGGMLAGSARDSADIMAQLD
mgnify:CR=1 FL=1